MTRAALEQSILDGLAGADGGNAPGMILVTGSRGAGKSRLLHRAAGRLATLGFLPVVADVERIGTSLESFCRHLIAAVDRPARLAGLAPGPAELARDLDAELSRSRPNTARLLETALSYPQAAAAHHGRPVALMLDELGEIAPLTRQAGLRSLPEILALRLCASRQLALLATASHASRPRPLAHAFEQAAAATGRSWRMEPLPPLADDEMAAILAEINRTPPRSTEVAAWIRATGGRPLYAEILARAAGAADEGSLLEALAREMETGGRLERECRLEYHLLVERSRGHAVVRSILALLASTLEANLTAVARHVHTTLPTAMDYLSWMLEVGLIERAGRLYRFADPVLRLWVALHGPEPADALEEAARTLAASSPGDAASSMLSPPEREVIPVEEAPSRRSEFPMEID